MIYKFLKPGEVLQEKVEELFKEISGVSPVSLENNEVRSHPSKVLVCIECSQVIAAIEVYDVTSIETRIINLAVKSDFRYKGIATGLLTRIESGVGSKHEEACIRLIPTSDSCDFYLKNGYKPDLTHEYDWFKKINT